jgi:multimeric flavodoxin WrbA
MLMFEQSGGSMKVLGINGSPHRNGNTAVMLEWALDALRENGAETERYDLAGRPIAGCIDCRRCFTNKDSRCAVGVDCFNEVFEKIIAADGVLIAAPTYVANIPASVKAMIERIAYVNKANDWVLKRKVGASIVVARRGGAIDAFNAINHVFLHAGMIIPGSCYWNMGYGWRDQDVLADQEAQVTMRTLGENVAWLLRKTLAQ